MSSNSQSTTNIGSRGQNNWYFLFTNAKIIPTNNKGKTRHPNIKTPGK